MTPYRAPEGWSAEGANSHGFVGYENLKRLAHELSATEFVERFPVPALRVLDTDPGGSGIRSLLPGLDRGVQLLTERVEGVSILRYLGKVAFVAKRPGNPFPHLISIGRSKSNDITIAVDSVSKVHGYFVTDDEGSWCFTDHGSTNGTRIGRKKVGAGKKTKLADANTLKLGLEACFEYLQPESLYRQLRGG